MLEGWPMQSWCCLCIQEMASMVHLQLSGSSGVKEIEGYIFKKINAERPEDAVLTSLQASHWDGKHEASIQSKGSNHDCDILELKLEDLYLSLQLHWLLVPNLFHSANQESCLVHIESYFSFPTSELEQIDRELKRERRKQSNQESARGSRLRKQEVQVGMDPAGELRYPSYPKKNEIWKFP